MRLLASLFAFLVVLAACGGSGDPAGGAERSTPVQTSSPASAMSASLPSTTVAATGADSTGSTSTSTLVVPITEPVGASSRITIGSDGQGDGEVAKGAPVLVEAGGFAPFSDVVIELHSDPVELVTTTADGAGTISVVVELPTDIDDGSHDIVVIGTDQNGAPIEYEEPVTVSDAESGEAALFAPSISAVSTPVGLTLRDGDQRYGTLTMSARGMTGNVGPGIFTLACVARCGAGAPPTAMVITSWSSSGGTTNESIVISAPFGAATGVWRATGLLLIQRLDDIECRPFYGPSGVGSNGAPDERCDYAAASLPDFGGLTFEVLPFEADEPQEPTTTVGSAPADETSTTTAAPTTTEVTTTTSTTTTVKPSATTEPPPTTKPGTPSTTTTTRAPTNTTEPPPTTKPGTPSTTTTTKAPAVSTSTTMPSASSTTTTTTTASTTTTSTTTTTMAPPTSDA